MVVPELTPITKTNDTHRVQSKQQSTGHRREIKLANYDGSSEWNDVKSHFDACATINDWDDRDKGLYLATALRGQAQGVSSDLPVENKMDYNTLVKTLEKRFAPPNLTELYRVQLKERCKRASESLPELGQAIRRLVNKVYVTAPAEVKETLSMEHFLDALVDSEMQIRIKQARPSNLNQAICLAVELEAFYKTERKYETGRAHMHVAHAQEEKSENTVYVHVIDKMNDMMKPFTQQIDTLRKEVGEFKSSLSAQKLRQDFDWKKNIKCFACGKIGHYHRQCPAEKRGATSTREQTTKE